MYRLKEGQESFTVVDGPLAGRTFIPGQPYPEIPPEEAHRFKHPGEAVMASMAEKEAPAAESAKPAKADKQRADAPSEKSEVK